MTSSASASAARAARSAPVRVARARFGELPAQRRHGGLDPLDLALGGAAPGGDAGQRRAHGPRRARRLLGQGGGRSGQVDGALGRRAALAQPDDRVVEPGRLLLGVGELLGRPPGPEARRLGPLHRRARGDQQRAGLLDRPRQPRQRQGGLVEHPAVLLAEAADDPAGALDLAQGPLVGGPTTPGRTPVDDRVVARGRQVGLGGSVAHRGHVGPRPAQPAGGAQLLGRAHGVRRGALLVVEGEEALGGRVARLQRTRLRRVVPAVRPAEHLAPLACPVDPNLPAAGPPRAVRAVIGDPGRVRTGRSRSGVERHAERVNRRRKTTLPARTG
jgi:hypothetical protein